MVTKSHGPSSTSLLYKQRFKWLYIPDNLCYETNALPLSLTSKDQIDPTKKPEWLVLEKKLYVTLQDRVSEKNLDLFAVFFFFYFVICPLERSGGRVSQ